MIISTGDGGVSALSPTSNDQVLCLDSNASLGAKFMSVGSISPSQQVKLTSPKRPSTNSNAFEVIMSMSVKGENTALIKTIDVVGYKTGNATSYDVRVYDATNSLVVAEVNFTNAALAVNPMGTLANLPAGAALFEFQAKRNGGNAKSDVFIEEVTVEYQTL